MTRVGPRVVGVESPTPRLYREFRCAALHRGIAERASITADNGLLRVIDEDKWSELLRAYETREVGQ